eukprot:4786565-Pleurochrysis_carterae.AAC.1
MMRKLEQLPRQLTVLHAATRLRLRVPQLQSSMIRPLPYQLGWQLYHGMVLVLRLLSSCFGHLWTVLLPLGTLEL